MRKEKNKYKILDFQQYGNVIKLYLGNIGLEDWSGEGWNEISDSSLLESDLVDSEFVVDTIQLVINPDKYNIVSMYDMEDSGHVGFSKHSLINNNFPIFILTKETRPSLNPSTLFWQEESIRFYMGQEIEVDFEEKFIPIGY